MFEDPDITLNRGLDGIEKEELRQKKKASIMRKIHKKYIDYCCAYYSNVSQENDEERLNRLESMARSRGRATKRRRLNND